MAESHADFCNCERCIGDRVPSNGHADHCNCERCLLARLVETLRSNRFSFTSEDELQRGIGLALQGATIPYEREVRLTAADRPDFMVRGIAIEVKIDGTANALLRQLVRYASLPAVHALVVVTNRARLTSQPKAINGRPVHVVSLLGSSL